MGVTVAITLLMASKHMVHLSMVMVSIPIMVNLMASIIRTTTLLRVIRNNHTIKNHILANLNKVNILTLTSLSMSLTEELSPSMTSTLSLSMSPTEELSPSMTSTLSLSMTLTEELSPSITSTPSPSKTLLVGLPRLSMTSTLSPSKTLIVGLPRLSITSTLSHSMTLTEEILIPAILSRHIVNQSSDHQASLKRVVIQLLQTINPSLLLISALLIDKSNRNTSPPVESLAVMQLMKDPVARTQISLRIIRNQVNTKMKVMTTLVFMKICLVPILWRKFLQNMQEKSNFLNKNYFPIKKLIIMLPPC